MPSQDPTDPNNPKPPQSVNPVQKPSNQVIPPNQPNIPTQKQTPAPPVESLADATSYAQSSMGNINKTSLPTFGKKYQEETPPQEPPPPVMNIHRVNIFSKIKKLLIIIFFLLLLTSPPLALSYTNFQGPFNVPKPIIKTIDSLILLSPLPETPRLILTKSQEEMAKLKTATIETEIKFSTENTNFPLQEASINIKGPFDLNSQNLKKSQFNISGSVKTEGLSFSASGEVRVIDDFFYFRLTEFPGGSVLPLQEIKNQWFYAKIEEESIDDPEKLQQIIDEITVLVDNFTAKSHAWTTKDADNKQNYVLTLKPPREEINKLIVGMVEIVEKNSKSKLEQSLENEDIEELTRNLKNLEIKMAISKDTYLVESTEVIIKIEAQAPDLSSFGEVTLSPNTTMPIEFTTTMSFSNFNQPVIIEIPENAQNIEGYTDELRRNIMQSPLQEQLLPQGNPPPNSPEQSQIGDFLGESTDVLGVNTSWLDLLLGLDKP